jgi:hypothetical protein
MSLRSIFQAELLYYYINKPNLSSSLIINELVIAFLGENAKLPKETNSLAMSVAPSIRPSVCPYGSTRLPLDGFS